jgi:hypothetical protein
MENIRQNMPSGLTRTQRLILCQAYDIAEGLNADISYIVFENRGAYNGPQVRNSLRINIYGQSPDGFEKFGKGLPYLHDFKAYSFFATFGVKGGVKDANIKITCSSGSGCLTVSLTKEKAKIEAKDFNFFQGMLIYRLEQKEAEEKQRQRDAWEKAQIEAKSLTNLTVLEIFDDVSKEYQTEEESMQIDVRNEKWEQAFYRAYMVKHGISVLDYYGQRLRETLWSIYNLFGSAQADLEMLKKYPSATTKEDLEKMEEA